MGPPRLLLLSRLRVLFPVITVHIVLIVLRFIGILLFGRLLVLVFRLLVLLLLLLLLILLLLGSWVRLNHGIVAAKRTLRRRRRMPLARGRAEGVAEDFRLLPAFSLRI